MTIEIEQVKEAYEKAEETMHRTAIKALLDPTMSCWDKMKIAEISMLDKISIYKLVDTIHGVSIELFSTIDDEQLAKNDYGVAEQIIVLNNDDLLMVDDAISIIASAKILVQGADKEYFFIHGGDELNVEDNSPFYIRGAGASPVTLHIKREVHR